MTTAREETSRLADLLRSEHHALAEFLAALAEFDRERRWLELGYNSLFSFLVRELGLSKGAAFYRKTAAELVRSHPDVLEALRAGKLCLTSIVELAKVITPENEAEIVPRFFHLSKLEAKEVTAELLPAATPPHRTVVTTAPPVCIAPALVLAPAADTVGGAAAAIDTIEVFQPTWSVPTAAAPDGAPPAPRPRAQPMAIEPLTADLRRIHVTVSRRVLDKLAAARDALSHSHPNASEETILEVGLDLVIQRHAKRRGIGAKPRAAASRKDAAGPGAVPAPPTPSARSRHVPAAVARAVWERDQGCCAWPLENGGVCGSTRQVEIDHIHGWAVGAGTTIEELRLLCRMHQDVSARQLYGDDLMNNYTKPKGGTCSEPAADYGLVASLSAAPARPAPWDSAPHAGAAAAPG